jgi:hypothetical protein
MKKHLERHNFTTPSHHGHILSQNRSPHPLLRLYLTSVALEEGGIKYFVMKVHFLKPPISSGQDVSPKTVCKVCFVIFRAYLGWPLKLEAKHILI